VNDLRVVNKRVKQVAILPLLRKETIAYHKRILLCPFKSETRYFDAIAK